MIVIVPSIKRPWGILERFLSSFGVLFSGLVIKPIAFFVVVLPKVTEATRKAALYFWLAFSKSFNTALSLNFFYPSRWNYTREGPSFFPMSIANTKLNPLVIQSAL